LEPKDASSCDMERAEGAMPTSPTVQAPSSRPTSMPSAPTTGTRRSSESSAPIMNSASACAVAVRLRTTSTPARAHASRSRFSAPALTRPTTRNTGA
jgi:hypothetical protein